MSPYLNQALLSIDEVSQDGVYALFELAQKKPTLVKGAPCGALCFFEASSRTKLSFERAGQILGVKWLDFTPDSSSLQKGESFRESLRLLKFYGADFLVVRHSQTGFARYAQLWTELPVFNAGDGAHEHPTQALGDALCLWQCVGRRSLKVAFYGDVSRSRVARSVTKLFKKLGHQILVTDDGSRSTELFSEAFQLERIARTELKKMDVVYALRTQKERGSSSRLGPLRASDLGLETLVMHAGPVVEGEDLAYELCHFEQDRMLVHEQVQACLQMRVALLAQFLGAKS